MITSHDEIDQIICQRQLNEIWEQMLINSILSESPFFRYRKYKSLTRMGKLKWWLWNKKYTFIGKLKDTRDIWLG